jgi:hypothetical protein
VSRRNGLYNVFGIRFDSSKGKSVGSPFQVTGFDNPSAMIPREIMGVELGVSQDRLLITVEQLSGSIWVLDHADR